MAQLVGDDEIESLRIELAEIGRSLRSSFQRHASSFRNISDIMIEASKREKQAGIVPDPDIDAYMKGSNLRNLECYPIRNQSLCIYTAFCRFYSGLHICADTLSGDAMRRGEMIVGPTKALFMDEISNGLDSFTTYQIVACLQQLTHIADATVLVALLQPAPETFDLFDDIILMTEGKIVLGICNPSHHSQGSSFNVGNFSLETSVTYYVIGYSPEAGSLYSNLVEVGILDFPDDICWSYVSLSVIFLSFLDNMIFYPFMTLTENTTIGQETLESRGLHFHGYLFLISLGALLGFIIIFNIGFTLSLTFLNSPGSRAIISNEKLSQIQGSEDSSGAANAEVKSMDSPNTTTKSHRGQVVLPFEPLTLVFQDVQYNVDTPDAMRERGFTPKKKIKKKSNFFVILQLEEKLVALLKEILELERFLRFRRRLLGFRVTVSKPTYILHKLQLKNQWLILLGCEFVKEVLEIIELDEIKDCLVGMPGVSGLSTEQRKRLTISMELVANPSIIFMDEPTTGLDAKAAAIVMQAMKNVAETGRTIVCTIHQPSIDIFEAFDEV
ncbi:Pleiotropic drug resistance protein 3 [Camellia lanceoleosa]|uniref:Pleiotropic drug resistance protein 3 n=1 Tax=Camellia lanceoleosa TaxID=1840588 RepID=A0ACC0ISU8_9ERIC|nr:Pleiotropic drug resistance protein 3 [Camellia lanceoleosa]